MNANLPKELDEVPFLRWTPVFYRALLRLTKRHGMFTIARNHVRRYPKGQKILTPAGGCMFIPADPHFIGFLTGVHEEHITHALREIVEPGSLCLDVGANIGYFTVMMSSLSGETGIVYAFEPESRNFELLTANASLAGKSAAPIIARNVAISDEAGSVNLIAGDESTLHQVFNAGMEPSHGTSIAAISLDSILAEIGERKVKVLKVDVEGHELPAIIGAHQLISSRAVENLIIEVTPGEDASRLEQLIAPYARSIRVWLYGQWTEMPITSLPTRTDVWIRF